jgi:hypothetical protein
VTPGRPRTPLAALLAALAVACGAAGGLLVTAAPEATGADAGRVPVAAAVPDGDRPTSVGSHPPTSGGSRPPTPGSHQPGGPAPSPPVGERSPTGTGGHSAVHSPGGRRVEPAAPRRLLIGSARLQAPVVPVGDRGDGQLALPEDPRTIGWWVGSAPAGDPRGSTVLAGHVDSVSAGPGALAVLRTVPVGTAVVLVDAFGARHPYRVAARRSYPKAALPPDLLRGGGGPRLVLITCGGPFDEARHSYRDNLVVYAVPA